MPVETMRAEAGTSEGRRGLLRWGVVAGPFYLGLGLAQALLRDGFDLGRHPLSLLANGPGGWVQTLNFVVSGAMVLAATVGVARALGPRSRLLATFLGLYGVGMLLAAVFPADPVDGFPPGTPLGMPTEISTVGLLHFVAGSLTFLGLGLAGVFATRPCWRHGLRGLGWFSLACGVAVLFGFFGGLGLALGVGAIWAAVVIGCAWLAILCWRLGWPAGA